MRDDIGLIIRKYSLKNASDYGKASLNSVIGKVLGENADLRARANEIRAIAVSIVDEVNKLSKEEIEKELSSFTFTKVEKIKEHRFIIPNPQEGVITRFAPEPSGYPHIGHAKAMFLEYEVANDYNGKMLLRFDDTNPKKEKQEYVDAMKDAMSWLGVKYAKESYTSDSMKKIYDIAKSLIEKGFIYSTKASIEEIKEARAKGTTISGRENSKQENLELWDQMLGNKFNEGEIVLLLKSDLSATNSVMRDPTMFRIISAPHYRQGEKYVVWPTYDFEAPFMDSWEGITHAMRSKEYELREELYYKMLDLTGMRKPTLVHFSRLDIKNSVISKRHLVPLVESGKLWGWNDPRLPTIQGLKTRGICQEAIKNFALRFGIGKQEKEVDWDFLIKENRQVLDSTSRHLFLVRNPILLELKGDHKTEVELSNNPNSEMGKRKLEIGNKVYIEQEDWDSIKDGEIFRLKDFANVKANKKENLLETVEAKELPKLKIHWVPEKGAVKASLIKIGNLLNDDDSFNENSLENIECVAESSAKGLKQDEIVQLERIGYSILHDKKKMEFILSE
ncbi:MAG: glutamate--tRNA ligase [Candidatus Micrarchaeota archaeon]|nr:glutamate--tRNA ligase [Candidatus Micrarchaeota archaeon]